MFFSGLQLDRTVKVPILELVLLVFELWLLSEDVESGCMEHSNHKARQIQDCRGCNQAARAMSMLEQYQSI